MTQNGEAQTPSGGQPFSMADMVGFMMRDLFSHGINMEEHLVEAQTGARNLAVQLRMAHQAIDERERSIGELQDSLNRVCDLVQEAFALVGAAFSRGSQPITIEWMRAAEVWAERWHGTFPNEAHRHLTDGTPLPYAQPVQTDAQPTEAVNPTCTKGGHLTSSCEHAPDDTTTPAPPAG